MNKPWWEENPDDYIDKMNKGNIKKVNNDDVDIEFRQDGIYAVANSERVEGEMKLNVGQRLIQNFTGQEALIFTEENYKNGSKTRSQLLTEIRRDTGLELPDSMFKDLFKIVNPPTGGQQAPCFPIALEPNGTWMGGVTTPLIVENSYDINLLVVKAQSYVADVYPPVEDRNGQVIINTGRGYGCTIKPTVPGVYDIGLNISTSGVRIYLMRFENWGTYKLDMTQAGYPVEPLVYNFGQNTCHILFFKQFNTMRWIQLPADLSKPGVWKKAMSKLASVAMDDENIYRLMNGHVNFLNKNTGKYVDPKVDRFVINDTGVVVNNRHYTYNTRQEGQPDGDATTEGQSINIAGFIEAYRAADGRGSAAVAADWLSKAERLYDAYITAFYAGEQPPDTPARWASNWIVNGKAPVLAHYPLAPADEFPTHGGFKNIDVEFNAGIGRIPHGAPYWGEYLDVVGKAYRGLVGWNAINATIYQANEDGSVNYNAKGVEYEVQGIYTWSMEIIESDGTKVADFTAPADIGMIVLKDKTVTGAVKMSFAVRLPVEHGGYMIQTNECQHNRPIQVPVASKYKGNASDAEQWFCEVAYDLWKITGNDKYRKAYLASLYTIMEYVFVDANDKFFRQVVGNSSPDTDGISYNYTYPSGVDIKYDRDENGYIRMRSEEANGVKITMEQNAIWFYVDNDSVLRVTYKGVDDAGRAMGATAVLILSPDKSDEKRTTYTFHLPAGSEEMSAIDLPLNSIVKPVEPNRGLLISQNDVTWHGGCNITTVQDGGPAPGQISTVIMANAIEGEELSFSCRISYPQTIRKVRYFSTFDANFRMEDTNGWRWWVMLPAGPDWQTKDILDNEWKLSAYQPNHPEATSTPSMPDWASPDDEFTILRGDGVNLVSDRFSIFGLNELPSEYGIQPGYTMLFNLTFAMEGPGTAYMGDCTIIGARNDALPYTPGVIPFSNNNIPDAPTFDSWRGQPYPGYQYPFFYCYQTLEENPDRDLMIKNVIDFWWDSQQWYHDKFGVLGPGASAFVWDRWDKPANEEPNTWTMWHFGDSEAWSGYQPRAFYGAVMMHSVMKEEGFDIPPKLTEYITNWLTYLQDFVSTNKVVPTEFPMDKAPVPIENDFTGHMSGLYLAGISRAYLSGIRVPGHITLAKLVYDEIQANYIQNPENPDTMNGGWSPWGDPGNNGANGMFFGFWAGELLRGLGWYQRLIQYMFMDEA